MPKPRKTPLAQSYIGVILGLIARRKAAGLTQWALARALGEDQSYVSRIERCQRRLDLHEYALLCGLLNLDPGELLRPIAKSVVRLRARKRLAK
jgi:transcriptional regulator with XRE-family HTH domain